MTGIAAAIGNFDGVHLGHASLMRKAIEVAGESGLKPCAITFDPHPERLYHDTRNQLERAQPHERHHHHHHHHHHHDDEHVEQNPAFKYSRQANEKPAVNPQSNHGHSHDHEDSKDHANEEHHHHEQSNDDNKDILFATEKGYGKRTPVDEYRFTNRGGKGVKTINVTDKTGNLDRKSVV